MLRQAILVLAALAALLFVPKRAVATEICGNGIDDNSNGLADEGCRPSGVPGVRGVHESPLPGHLTGFVSPKTGQLVWTEPPDLAPNVPYGPPLTFTRMWLGQYDPGYNDPGATDYRAPLGHRWHHNFMGWLDLDTTPNPDEVVVHLTTGQDVLFTFDSNAAGYDYYTPQPGYYVDYLRQNTSSGTWQLRTIEGLTYEYATSVSNTWKLTSIIEDPGNELTIAYGTSGQVNTVTDASGLFQLAFDYGTTGARTVTAVKLKVDGTVKATLSLPNS